MVVLARSVESKHLGSPTAHVDVVPFCDAQGCSSPCGRVRLDGVCDWRARALELIVMLFGHREISENA